ncbi:MAG TPA: hypothetical protein DDZ51_24985 [Planctomycetaceae bacterium]|nr:hypothetical protein [Planctomycetaceae bacterium]
MPVSELTPEQRFQQIAAILAKGLVRCQRRRKDAIPSGSDQSERLIDGLEDSGNSRLSVS